MFGKFRKGKSVRGRSSDLHLPDLNLLALVAILTLFGLIMVYDASAVVASERYGDQFRFLKLQLIWVGLGIVAATVAYFFDYHLYPKLVIPLISVTVFLLIGVLFAGTSTFGAKRWFDFGVINVQPAELTKLVLTIYLASWLSKTRQTFAKLNEAFRHHMLYEFLPFVLLLGFICLLIVIEPDLGTTVIVGVTAMGVYFISGTELLHTVGSVFIVLLMGLLGVVAAILEPYRLQRIVTYMKVIFTGKVDDPLGTGYQILQVLIAIGSGGLWGVGFGESRQKFFYLVGDTAFTDTIFAVFAEEFGFVGSVILLLAFVYFIYRGIRIAKNAPDRLGMLLAAGITIWIGIQTFLNIAANIGLGPLTGIPLPFFSYGGSSMIVAMTGVGILLNVSRYAKEE